jgi:AcrR family transcriptional regulator
MTRVPAYYLENRTVEILDAAWNCFARKGYYQTTMQEIAAEVGLTPGALYRYYPGKEAILEAIAERSREQDSALFAAARAAGDEAIGSLAILGDDLVNTFRSPEFDTAARVGIELRPEYLRNEVLLESVRQDLESVRSQLVEMMREAQKKGQLRTDIDAESLAVLALSVNEGMRFLSLVDGDNFDIERCLDLIRMLVAPQLDRRSTRKEER